MNFKALSLWKPQEQLIGFADCRVSNGKSAVDAVYAVFQSRKNEANASTKPIAPFDRGR
jgi:hypothetical protein